jgi:hypothetical protein
MFLTRNGWLVADSARVWAVALELGIVADDQAAGRPHPFATPLGTRRVIERIGIERAEAYGVILDGEPGEALVEGMVRLWQLDGLDAHGLAAALVEGGRFAHLLRFAHTDPERRESGGYSVTVIG